MSEVVGWDFWKRGDICVIRCVIRNVHRQHEVLRIRNKRDYKEWSGCFSII